MQVLRRAIGVFYVNRQVVMVVVISRLRVQNGMLKFLIPVRRCQGANHNQALPQNGQQHQNGSESVGHGVKF